MKEKIKTNSSFNKKNYIQGSLENYCQGERVKSDLLFANSIQLNPPERGLTRL